MSSLFTQMNKISQEAQKQRSLASGGDPVSTPTPSAENPTSTSSTPAPMVGPSSSSPITPAISDPSIDNPENVTASSDVVTSQSDVTKTKSSRRSAKELASDALGKGSRIDLDKLRTVIEEVAAVKTSAFGFSVRMSEREKADIEDFILETLRKEGIKGYEVSIAKLMRYAMRYMFRVHPQEFVTALRAALEVEETLSI